MKKTIIFAIVFLLALSISYASFSANIFSSNFTETDTLQSVTDRGASTSNNIIVNAKIGVGTSDLPRAINLNITNNDGINLGDRTALGDFYIGRTANGNFGSNSAYMNFFKGTGVNDGGIEFRTINSDFRIVGANNVRRMYFDQQGRLYSGNRIDSVNDQSRSLNLIDTASVALIWRYASTGASLELINGQNANANSGLNGRWEIILRETGTANTNLLFRSRTGGGFREVMVLHRDWAQIQRNLRIGQGLPTEALDVDGNGLFNGTVTATDFITTSRVADFESSQRSLDKLSNVDEWTKSDNSLDYEKHYAYTEIERKIIVDYDIFENPIKCKVDCEDYEELITIPIYGTITQKGLSMETRIAEMEKMIWELKHENIAMRERLNRLEGVKG